MNTVQTYLSVLLKKGYNPFHDNAELTNKYFDKVNLANTVTEVLIKKEIIPEQVSVVVKKNQPSEKLLYSV